MGRPVLVEAASELPISLDDVKAALRVDGEDSNADINRLIRGAVEHYEGWTGVLGVCFVTQSWRQAFSSFENRLVLSLRPVASVTSISWRDSAGTISTVAPGNYQLKTGGDGVAYVQFLNAFSAPTDLFEDDPISVEFVAGWPLKDGKPTTPADIQTAIIMHVQKHYDEAAQSSVEALERIERDLVSKYRGVQI